MTATHPMDDANLKRANGASVLEKIEKSKNNPNELANLYRTIENGRFEDEIYPFKLTLQYQIQDSLFAAYEFEIRNSDSERLFVLWKKINRADKNNIVLLSEKKRKALRKMIQANFPITLRREIKKAIEWKNVLFLLMLLIKQHLVFLDSGRFLEKSMMIYYQEEN